MTELAVLPNKSKLHSRLVPTEGIKYAGSKLKLIPQILEMASIVSPNTIYDPFSGTTRVSQAFAKNGLRTISSDISAWSEVFGECYLKSHSLDKSALIIKHLNKCRPKSGWFTEVYGGDPSVTEDKKKPWQIKNTMLLDSIREEIDKMSLNPLERSMALTSLILALDKVDNSMGHFTSYLKDWSPRSYNELILKVPLLNAYKKKNKVLRGNVFDLAPSVTTDLVYLDPPYGSNNEKMPASRVRYASYYHLWTTVILNDQPDIFGAAGRRVDTRDTVSCSIFEEFKRDQKGEFIAIKAIEQLLHILQAKYILLSYSSGGRATAEDLNKAINNVGKLLSVQEINYKKNVMSGMRWTNDWFKDSEDKNIEFLFLIEKNR